MHRTFLSIALVACGQILLCHGEWRRIQDKYLQEVSVEDFRPDSISAINTACRQDCEESSQPGTARLSEGDIGECAAKCVAERIRKVRITIPAHAVFEHPNHLRWLQINKTTRLLLELIDPEETVSRHGFYFNTDDIERTSNFYVLNPQDIESSEDDPPFILFNSELFSPYEDTDPGINDHSTLQLLKNHLPNVSTYQPHITRLTVAPREHRFTTLPADPILATRKTTPKRARKPKVVQPPDPAPLKDLSSQLILIPAVHAVTHAPPKRS